MERIRKDGWSLPGLLSLAAALLALIMVFPLKADTGRIPISQVGATLLNPGSYYLTRDLDGSSQSISAVVNIASNNVTLDLNGHTIKASSSSYCVLDSGFMNCTVTHGRLVGGSMGVSVTSPGRVEVSHIRASGQSGNGIYMVGDNYSSPCIPVIKDVTVYHPGGYGVFIDKAAGGRLERVRVFHAGSSGLGLSNFNGGIVRDNVITNATNSALYLSASNDNLILENVFGEASQYGIDSVSSNGNSIVRNDTSSNSGATAGIYIGGDNNTVDWNTSSANGTYGIQLTGSGNEYSDNRTQGNTSAGIQDSGTGNINGGGNH